MTKINSARIETDVALTEDQIDEIVDLVPIEKLKETFKQMFKPAMLLAASMGVTDTATMAEMVGAARLNGDANPGVGYDVTVTEATGVGHIEVKTRTAFKNSSSNTTRNEQKVIVKLTPKQRKKADYLLLTVVAHDFKADAKVITYYIIPRQAFKEAFDVRLNHEGRPIGNCKYSAYAFSEKSEMKERLKATPSYKLEEMVDVGPKTAIPTLTHYPVIPGDVVDIFSR